MLFDYSISNLFTGSGGSGGGSVQVTSVPASLVPYSLSFSARVSSPHPISKVESHCSLDPLQYLNTEQTQATVGRVPTCLLCVIVPQYWQQDTSLYLYLWACFWTAGQVGCRTQVWQRCWTADLLQRCPPAHCCGGGRTGLCQAWWAYISEVVTLQIKSSTSSNWWVTTYVGINGKTRFVCLSSVFQALWWVTQ